MDSNVLMFGLISETGPSRVLFDLAEAGLIELHLSRQVREEVAEKLKEHSLRELVPLMRQYLVRLKVVQHEDPSSEQVREAAKAINLKDASILAGAKKANVG